MLQGERVDDLYAAVHNAPGAEAADYEFSAAPVVAKLRIGVGQSEPDGLDARCPRVDVDKRIRLSRG